MNANEMLDRIHGILKAHLGEEAARNICVSVYDEATFYAASEARPDGYVRSELRISVCEKNCRPEITADIGDCRGPDREAVLEDFERRIVPQIKRAFKGVHCGFDPVLLGC